MVNNYISIGKILNFHGVKGEAKFGYTKNREDFLEKLEIVYIQYNGEYREFEIAQLKFTPKCAIVKFKGIDSLNEILDFKGCLVFVKEESIRENLDEDEFLIDELVGLNVYDGEERVGSVVGVEVIQIGLMLEIVGIHIPVLNHVVGLHIVVEFLDFQGIAILGQNFGGNLQNLRMGRGGSGHRDGLVVALTGASGKQAQHQNQRQRNCNPFFHNHSLLFQFSFYYAAVYRRLSQTLYRRTGKSAPE